MRGQSDPNNLNLPASQKENSLILTLKGLRKLKMSLTVIRKPAMTARLGILTMNYQTIEHRLAHPFLHRPLRILVE
jgi:hypothetical protein